MKKGLVLGKFFPLHKGHVELIRFAASQCDRLYVFICKSDQEEISGEVRLDWIRKVFKDTPTIQPLLFEYNEADLINSSIPSRSISEAWSQVVTDIFGKIDVFFSSEKYGEYMAEYLGCQHHEFDYERKKVPVSASVIRSNPFAYWDFLPDPVKPYYIKKVVLLGTESTGKSTLAEKLSRTFDASFVPEVARGIVSETVSVRPEHLQEIMAKHAEAISDALPNARRLLFIDTDHHITQSYAKFLFQKELKVPEMFKMVSKADLYIYLEKDAPYVQDGTRLSKTERDRLDQSHRQVLEDAGIPYICVNGTDWEEREKKVVKLIQDYFKVTS